MYGDADKPASVSIPLMSVIIIVIKNSLFVNSVHKVAIIIVLFAGDALRWFYIRHQSKRRTDVVSGGITASLHRQLQGSLLIFSSIAEVKV